MQVKVQLTQEEVIKALNLYVSQHSTFDGEDITSENVMVIAGDGEDEVQLTELIQGVSFEIDM